MYEINMSQIASESFFTTQDLRSLRKSVMKIHLSFDVTNGTITDFSCRPTEGMPDGDAVIGPCN